VNGPDGADWEDCAKANADEINEAQITSLRTADMNDLSIFELKNLVSAPIGVARWAFDHGVA
jgi:hypothetical protein